MDKTEIRRYMRSREAAFYEEKGRPEAESSLIWSMVEALPEFAGASTVLVYMSMRGEPCTEEFIARWHLRKKLAIPLVKGELLELREYSPDALVRGYKGIVEPSDSAPVIDESLIDLALVPGIAFSRVGDGFVRLGHGGGFYDRLLPRLQCPTVGVGFSFRLLDSIPADPWDRCVSRVIIP